MASHRKSYDVYAVGGFAKTVDRNKSVRVCGVEAQSLKDAEAQGRRFCSLVNCTMTHLKEIGYATKGKRDATNN